MLGNVIELCIVVRDLEQAIATYTRRFGLRVLRRGRSEEFGFVNAILPTGLGHIELLQPTDPESAAGRFLARRGEGVYLVGFECADIPGAVRRLRADGARVDDRRPDLAWVHPAACHGVFVELRHREDYGAAS
jgi:methylmalonyl-CoA/ethylmalonyl-CoA epimerase